MDGYKIYDGDDFNKIYEALSKFKKNNLIKS